jgi:hypothetical protein
MDATPTESTNAASDALSPVVATSSKEAAAALSDVGDHAARLGSKLEALSQDSTVPFVCHLCGVTRNFVATQTTCGFCFHPIDAQRAPSSSVASVAAEPAAASPTLSEVLAMFNAMDAKFNAIESTRQTAIEVLESKHQTSIADLRTGLADVRTELAEMRTTNDAMFSAIESTHRNAIEALESTHQNSIAGVRTEVAGLKRLLLFCGYGSVLDSAV